MLLTVLFLSFSCRGSIKNKRITEKNQDTIWEEIKDSKDLTVEEVQLFQGYVLRQGLQGIFSGKEPKLPVGKTIGEIIEEQRGWVAKQKVEEEKQKQLAAEAAAKEEEMRRVIRLTLFKFA